MKSSASTCVLHFSDEPISDFDSQVPTSPVIVATNPELKTSDPMECKRPNLLEPGDGDVNGTSFEPHKPLAISIQRDDIPAEDFCEMFKVLCASIVARPFVFTSHTLISTLRVATTYECHALRRYCIQYLETLELDAVKRIELAQELHIPDWEKPAYHELGMRDNPITREEAKIIGLETFVTIAEMREKEQRRREKEVDAVGGEQVWRSPVPASEVSAQGGTIGDGPQKASVAPLLGDTSQENSTATHADYGTEVGLSLVDIELSNVHAWSSQYNYNVEMPTCRCRFTYDGKPRARKCSMPSCVILALKDVQVQQLAQASRISDLESSAKKLEASFATETAPTAPGVQCTPMKLAPQDSPEKTSEKAPDTIAEKGTEKAQEKVPVVDCTRTGQSPAPILSLQSSSYLRLLAMQKSRNSHLAGR